MDSVYVLGVRVDSLEFREAAETMERWIGEKRTRVVVTPNPEICVRAFRDKEYGIIVNNSDLALPDGVGLLFAAKYFGQGLKSRIVGSEMLTEMLARAQARGWKVGCVIPPRGLSSVDDVERTLHERFSELSFVVVQDTDDALRKKLQEAQILFVALGSPKQEQWMNEHREHLNNARVMMGVGTGLDFITGRVRRAPLLFRRLGLEWFWRLLLSVFEKGDHVIPYKFWNRLARIWIATIIFPLLVITQRKNVT